MGKEQGVSEYKYPYIPKQYYPAVMFACKMIRETGFFNKSINSAAKYYGVEAKELEKHVRARQSAGQKGKQRNAYKYYAIAFDIATDHYVDGDSDLHGDLLTVIKATSKANAKKQLSDKHDSRRYTSGSVYAFVKQIEEFSTREEAVNKCREWERSKD